MGIEIEEPISEAFVCDTLFKKYHHTGWHEDRIPLTHESLTLNWVITRKKKRLMTYSGPSSVWRQFKLSGTILSSAMSMSAILLATKFFPLH